MAKIIAICGPDGAGKTTLSTELKKEGFHREYGGKKQNHSLFITQYFIKVHDLIKRKKMDRLGFLYLNIVFYPLEYIEHRLRLRKALDSRRKGYDVVFDRFVVDRMWRFKLDEGPNKFAEYIKWFFYRFYYTIYMNWFPRIDAYVFLLPPTDELLKRQPSDYSTTNESENIRSAYKSIADELEDDGENILVIDSNLDVNENKSTVMKWFNNL